MAREQCHRSPTAPVSGDTDNSHASSLVSFLVILFGFFSIVVSFVFNAIFKLLCVSMTCFLSILNLS